MNSVANNVQIWTHFRRASKKGRCSGRGSDWCASTPLQHNEWNRKRKESILRERRSPAVSAIICRGTWRGVTAYCPSRHLLWYNVLARIERRRCRPAGVPRARHHCPPQSSKAHAAIHRERDTLCAVKSEDLLPFHWGLLARVRASNLASARGSWPSPSVFFFLLNVYTFF